MVSSPAAEPRRSGFVTAIASPGRRRQSDGGTTPPTRWRTHSRAAACGCVTVRRSRRRTASRRRSPWRTATSSRGRARNEGALVANRVGEDADPWTRIRRGCVPILPAHSARTSPSLMCTHRGRTHRGLTIRRTYRGAHPSRCAPIAMVVGFGTAWLTARSPRLAHRSPFLLSLTSPFLLSLIATPHVPPSPAPPFLANPKTVDFVAVLIRPCVTQTRSTWPKPTSHPHPVEPQTHRFRCTGTDRPRLLPRRQLEANGQLRFRDMRGDRAFDEDAVPDHEDQ